jgi:prepilin-type N-terminal cleavage/methylation domain-containing protein
LQAIRVAIEAKTVKNSLARNFKIVNTQSLSAGFTLIELMVAMSLTVIVIGLTGFGLVAMMTNNSKAEARIQRRSEINRALDFISEEVRMARGVNRTPTTIAGTIIAGTPVTVSDVVTNAGLSSSDLGSPGTIVLYLEIPLTPTTCSGTLVSFDRVVYDIRSDTNTDPWLSPRIIKRYGRTPGIKGTIDPCSTPTSETFIDSISDININPDINSDPPCTSPPAVLSGTEGFYACVNGREVNLYLRSKVATKQFPAELPENVSTKAFSRIPQPPS